MAAPPHATVRNLSGNWVMNKSFSDDTSPALVLQGIGWLTRKAVGLATISLDVKHYDGEPTPSEDDEPAAPGTCSCIDIVQSASGLTSTRENRCVDNRWRKHEDWMFGKVHGRTFWISDPKTLGDEVTHGDAETVEFLSQGWLDEPAGPDDKTFIVSYVESLDPAAWTALQVWGFQDVGGERRHMRRICVRKGDKKVLFKLVYDFLLVGDDDDADFD
jgi:hypothetical protein